jgi:serine/threonine protein kinase
MKIKKVIGEGSYGSVVVCEKDGKEFALKTVKGDDYGLVSLQEVDIMNSVYNPFLCSASKTYIDNGSTLIFMDLASETLNKHEFKYDSDLKMAAFQMVCSLAFLEKRNIIHGDIKSNNFLCFSQAYGIENNVRLTDFSLSCRSYGTGSTPLFKMFCSIYRPMEAWYNEAECKSDVWALGCCLYELYTGDKQLFPSQDEKYDHKAYDLEERGKTYRRWKVSHDLYISALGQFAEHTNQNMSPPCRFRVSESNSRVQKLKSSIRLYVRDWKKLYRGLPDFIRDMLIVDSSARPSATELFHADYFSVERDILTQKLLTYYEQRSIPHSDGALLLLDGAVRHHLSRNPLDHEEFEYFMLKENYERVTKIIAMDIYSKCKHVGDVPYLIQGCLLIALKLTDPSKIEWFEYDRYTDRENESYIGHYLEPEDELLEILRVEQLICQTLNYVLYPETSTLFNLTDEQIRAFFV